MSHLNNLGEIEVSTKETVRMITERFYKREIDQFQYMEQILTCCAMIGGFCNSLKRSRRQETELISKLVNLRDDIAQPVMQMVYESITSPITNQKEIESEYECEYIELAV